MKKPVLKISVSDSEASSTERLEESENEIQYGSDADNSDAESGAYEHESNKDVLMTNKGWADSVAKILGSNKPKHKKTLVLSKAKKYSETIKFKNSIKPEFEVIGESSEPNIVKEEAVSSEPPAKKEKHDKLSHTIKPSHRVKPNILEKDRERLLTKIATKGVVQLFNAVRNQQKTLDKEMDRHDLSEAKKEKILKKFDKRTFLDTLMGQSKSIVVDEETKTLKNEVKAEDENPKWSALRDDFMTGAKMKDWDKESVDE